MTVHPERPLDDLDWKIITELQEDGRLSLKELGRRIALSPPAVTERLRRLEEHGVVTGFRAQVDPRRAGYPVLAFVEMRCSLGKCLLRIRNAEDYPEIAEVHRLSGDHCAMLKVRAQSLGHFERLLERLGEHGQLRSSVVLSTAYEDRPIQPPESPESPQHRGWNS